MNPAPARSRLPQAIVLTALLATAGLFSILFRVRIAPVFANDCRDLLYPAYFVVALASGALLLFSWRLAALSTLCCLAALIIGPSFIEGQRRASRTSSCANHILQSMSTVRNWSKEGKVFENTTDFDAMLRQVGIDESIWDPGLYCPGRADSTVKSGYVFVAGGLRPIDLPADALLYFCAAECHPGNDHRHAIVGAGDLACCDRDALATRIAAAIASGESRTIAYSKEAMAAMRIELTKLRTSP